MTTTRVLVLCAAVFVWIGAVQAQPPSAAPRAPPQAGPQLAAPAVMRVDPAAVRSFQQLRAVAAATPRRVRVIGRLSEAAVRGTAPPRIPIAASLSIPLAQISTAQGRLLSRLGSLGVPAAALDRLPYVVVEANPLELDHLIAEGEIAEVHEDALATTSVGASGQVIRAVQARALGATGAGTAIAILDTGVDRRHAFFGKRVVAEACFSTTSSTSQSVSACPGSGSAEYGADTARPCLASGCDHGTHVAGIAAGAGPRLDPLFHGVAPQARVVAVQVFSALSDSASDQPCGRRGRASPCALAFTSDIMRALQYVRDVRGQHNIVAANLSLAGPGSPTCAGDPSAPIIDALAAEGVATVAAAGNSGFNDRIGSPACVPAAVAVGATDNSDQRASFSNVSREVDLFAPGVDIRSSVPGGGYATMSGTSMAAPQVAGAIAALRSSAAVGNVSLPELIRRLSHSGTLLQVYAGQGGQGFAARIDVESGVRPPASSGTVNWARGYGLDLDTGLVTPAGADISFEALNTWPFVEFVPMNGAQIAPVAYAYGEYPTLPHPGYNGCRSLQNYSADRGPASHYGYCVRTSNGRIAFIRRTPFAWEQTLPVNWIQLSIVVWP